jgi:hypothetical protein
MACASCGSKPVTPVVTYGLPTIWAWLTPTPDLIAVPAAEATALLFKMNGPVT